MRLLALQDAPFDAAARGVREFDDVTVVHAEGAVAGFHRGVFGTDRQVDARTSREDDVAQYQCALGHFDRVNASNSRVEVALSAARDAYVADGCRPPGKQDDWPII